MKKVFISIAASGVLIVSPFAGCQKTSGNEYTPFWPGTPKAIYYNLPWSISADGDMYLELSFRIGIADSIYLSSHLRVYLKKEGDSTWINLPYVLLSNISQTSYSLFYTINSDDQFWYDTGGSLYIYVKQNAPITLGQRAIAGITYLP